MGKKGGNKGEQECMASSLTCPALDNVCWSFLQHFQESCSISMENSLNDFEVGELFPYALTFIVFMVCFGEKMEARVCVSFEKSSLC